MHRDIVYDAKEVEVMRKRISDLEAERAQELNLVAKWAISLGFATGHGDNISEILAEVGAQIRREREGEESKND